MAFQNRWGKLKQTQVPLTIIKDGKITLETDALAMLIVLLNFQKAQARRAREDDPAVVRIKHHRLMERTGYSVNKISRAIRLLTEGRYIRQVGNAATIERNKGGKFGASRYELLHPGSDRPLWVRKGQNLMYANNLLYFTFPNCVITESAERWSMASIRGSKLRLYVAILLLANDKRRNEFETSAAALRKLADLDPRTVAKSLESIEELGLVWKTWKDDRLLIEVCDPIVGEPLDTPDDDHESDPSNYYTTENGIRRRMKFNPTADEVERVIRDVMPDGCSILPQGTDNIWLNCPFHDDANPSCSVNLKKGGIFQCFACSESGNIYKLVAGLAKVSRADAIRRLAVLKGKTVEFRPPDSAALAIYSYRDKWGNLLKEVVRWPDGPDGEKKFSQRRPAPGGGWIDNAKGIGPVLFNADRLQWAETICVTEGEKDAVTVTNLKIIGQFMEVIGVTSGGANTWHPSLASQLRGKRVIIMPDDDLAGREYAYRIRESLEHEGITFREVSFAGTGAKDVSEFMETRGIADLVDLIGRGWVKMPGDRTTNDVSPEVKAVLIAVDKQRREAVRVSA